MYHLPSEAEWEKAARGPHGLIYPWGDAWQPGCCNNEDAGLKRPSPVGSFPLGASPYGALDMVGNVWEWCATKAGKAYPYDASEYEWSETYLEQPTSRRLRGGTYYIDQKGVRGAYRDNFPYGPGNRDDNFVGLRVASWSLQTDPDC